MANTMTVTFPGGVAVEAHYRGNSVRTDQPVAAGGGGTALSPFDLFLASIATCMGFYALRFCQERQIATDGLGLSLDTVKNPETKLVATIRVELTLPPGFPDRYHDAIRRAVDHCAVKRHLMEAPAFELEVVSPVVA